MWPARGGTPEESPTARLRSEHRFAGTREELIHFVWGEGLNRVHQMEKWRKHFPGVRKITHMKHGYF